MIQSVGTYSEHATSVLYTSLNNRHYTATLSLPSHKVLMMSGSDRHQLGDVSFSVYSGRTMLRTADDNRDIEEDRHTRRHALRHYAPPPANFAHN